MDAGDGHFWRDKDKNLWLKVFGKGRKIRDISVPQAFEPYLDRYRQYRGLPSRIEVNEQTALVEKITGTGGMTTRQLRRIVQEGFDAARLAMIEDGFGDEAKNLEDATTHYLRHTGASEDAVNRPIKHLSDDLRSCFHWNNRISSTFIRTPQSAQQAVKSEECNDR